MTALISSLRRIYAIAKVTVFELARLKLFYAICGLGILLILSSVFLARFSFQEEFQILRDISLGAMTIFTSVLAIAATANLIPSDVADRTAYAVLAKAVARFEYVIGKLIAVLILIVAAVTLMTLVTVALLKYREGVMLADALRTASPPETAAQIQRAASISAIPAAASLVFMKAAVLASLTLFVSTFATSNVFTVFVMFGVYLVAHLEPLAREHWANAGGIGARIFLAIVALVFPDLHAFDLSDVGVIAAALLAKTAILGVFYVAVYTLLAIASFNAREL